MDFDQQFALLAPEDCEDGGLFPQRLGRGKNTENLKGKSRHRKLVRRQRSLKSSTRLAGDGVSAADPNFGVTL